MNNVNPLMMPDGCPGCWRPGHDHRGKKCPSAPAWFKKLANEDLLEKSRRSDKLDYAFSVLVFGSWFLIAMWSVVAGGFQ